MKIQTFVESNGFDFAIPVDDVGDEDCDEAEAAAWTACCNNLRSSSISAALSIKARKNAFVSLFANQANNSSSDFTRGTMKPFTFERDGWQP